MRSLRASQDTSRRVPRLWQIIANRLCLAHAVLERKRTRKAQLRNLPRNVPIQGVTSRQPNQEAEAKVLLAAATCVHKVLGDSSIAFAAARIAAALPSDATVICAVNAANLIVLGGDAFVRALMHPSSMALALTAANFQPRKLSRTAIIALLDNVRAAARIAHFASLTPPLPPCALPAATTIGTPQTRHNVVANLMTDAQRGPWQRQSQPRLREISALLDERASAALKACTEADAIRLATVWPLVQRAGFDKELVGVLNSGTSVSLLLVDLPGRCTVPTQEQVDKLQKRVTRETARHAARGN